VFFPLLAIAVLTFCAALSALFHGESKRSAVACLGTSAGSLAGLAALFATPSGELIVPTNIPGVSFAFGSDPLSAFFLAVIFLISFFAGLYGHGYVKGQPKLIKSVPFFPLLVAAMAGVVVSRDGFSFLIIWEIMSLVSFFLVVSEHENKDVQYAGWVYLIATHLATAFLMAFFVIMAKSGGSMMFRDFALPGLVTPFMAGLLFVFAVIGFGTKAGIFPLHIWLPRAHPAAPSFISAIMSGVMIKTGIYGILRTISFFGEPPAWWGILLIVIGVVSAVMGVLYALLQHDLKRLLAYHSVENIGIIVTGIGIGLLGVSKGDPLVVTLGFGGAIFHVLNHAVFKGLLFLGAGSIVHATHTLAIDRLGGLLKKLPVTGVAFLVAAMSICGLPPFNGFISEWLIYMGLFGGATAFSGHAILLSVVGILGIAFAGGLAVACFTKVFGVVFLGEARTDILKDCREPSRLLTVPMIAMAVLCLLIGVLPWAVWSAVLPAVSVISNGSAIADGRNVISSLNWISILFAALIILATLLLALRRLLFRKKEVATTVTWDCGYAHPSPRMQYTAASFAEPIGTFFKFGEHVEDCAEARVFEPVFGRVGALLMYIRSKKKSTVQSYLALIFITLIIFFVLEVWFGI
jgi:hydrogenase-4 component B